MATIKIAETAKFVNCTCSVKNGDTVKAWENYYITANEGFLFPVEQISQQGIKKKVNGYLSTDFCSADRTKFEISVGPDDYTHELFSVYEAFESNPTSLLRYGTLTNCTCNKENDSEFLQGEQIIFTANDGYVFNGKINYSVDNVNKSRTATNEKTIVFDWEEPAGAVWYFNAITAVKEVITSATVHITGSFENCSCNKSDGEPFGVGDPIIITANSGYKFEGNFSFKRGETPETVSSADGKTLRIEFASTENNLNDVTLDSAYNAIKNIVTSAKVKITGTFKNCKCNKNNGDYFGVGDPVVISANLNHLFDDSFTFERWGQQYKVLSEDSGRTLQIDFKQKEGEESNDIILNDNYVAIEKEPTTAKVHITGRFTNCTCNKNDGGIFGIDDPIIITADEGYFFLDIYGFSRGNVLETVSSKDGGKTLQIDYEYKSPYLSPDVWLKDDYSATKKTVSANDFTYLYSPTTEELNELAKKRYINDFDFGTYILNLYKMPFAIPEVLKGGKRAIVLGHNKTDVLSESLVDYELTVDLGEIEVPEKYSNVYDYMNTECILYLPFFDKIYLNTEYVIGKKVTIELKVDLYSGECTANIFSTFTNEIIESVTSKIALQIPFIQKTNENVTGNISNIYKTGFSSPFIEVSRNIPYNVDTIFGRETVDFGTIGDYTGYIKVSDTALICSATNDEKTEIENLLETGVFIK